MKRFVKVLFILAALLCLTAIPASAATDAATVSAKYAAYRTKKGIKQYRLVDIDGNGIDEMIYGKYPYCGICTYNAKTNKVVFLKRQELGRSQPLVYYSTKAHRVMLYTLTTHSYDAKLYRIKGTKATLVKRVQSSYPLGGPSWNKINKKYASDAKVSAFWKTMNKSYTKVYFSYQ